VSPTARQRATIRLTQGWETPYAAAISLCERPSTTTAAITRRSFDLPDEDHHSYAQVLRHAMRMS
jgi:hypothetical protein